MILARLRFVVAGSLAMLGVSLAQTPDPQPLLTMKGHTDPVYSVAVSPDGKLLATGSFDKTVKLWDGVTGKEVRTLAGKNGHTNLVLGVGFSPDGSSLATVSTDNQLKIWDIANGKPNALLAHTAAVTRVAASADGKLLAAGAADGTIRIWTTVDGKLSQTLTGHAGAIVGLGFAPNGLTLHSAGADKTLRYWTPATGVSIGSVGVTHADITGFWVNPATGIVMIATSDGALKSFPAAMPVLPKPQAPVPATVTAMTLSGDGATLLAATDDKKLRSWNTATGVLTELGALPTASYQVAFGPAAVGYAVGQSNGHVLFIGVDGKSKGELLACESGLKSLAFSVDQTTLTTLGNDGLVRRWPVAGLIPAAPAKPMIHPVAVTAAIPSFDGKKVYAAAADNGIRIWNAGAVEREFKEHKAPITALAAVADAVLSTDNSGEAFLWNPADAKVLAKLAGTKKAPASFALLTPAKSAVIAYADGEVRFWPTSAAKDKEIVSFTLPKPAIALGFSVDGKQVVSISSDGSGQSTTLVTGKSDAQLAVAIANPTHSVFSSDRMKLAIVGNVKNVRTLVVLPNTASASSPLLTIPLPDAVEQVSFSRDSKRIALVAVKTGGRAVRMYDATTGGELQTVAEPTAIVVGLSWVDNKSVLIGSDKALSLATLQVDGVRATVPGSGLALLAPTPGWAIAATADKFVRIHETAPGLPVKEVKAFGPLQEVAKILAISKDNAVVAAATGKTLKLWQTADGKELPAPVLPAEVTQLAFSADRTRLAVGLSNNSAVVFTVATGLPEQIVTHAGPIAGLVFHPTQPLLIAASADKSISITPLVLAKQFSDPTVYGSVLAGTPSGANTLTGGIGKGVASANAGTGAKERTFGDAVGITAVAAHKNGQLVAMAHGPEASITVYNFADGAVLGTWKTGAKVTELAFHPTAPALAGVLADNKVLLWNVQSDAGQPVPPEFGKSMQELRHPAAVKGLSFAADGNTISTGCDDTQVRVWKFVSDQPSFTIAHPNIVHCAAFDKTGKFVATGCQDGILRIHDVTKAPATVAKAINAHILPQGQSIYAVAWHPDGKLVASASLDKSIKIWDATTGLIAKEIKPGTEARIVPAEVRTAAPGLLGASAGSVFNAPPSPGHKDQVFTLAFTKDGKQLASGSSDHTVKLWNPESGTLIREFSNPNLKSVGDGSPAPAHPGFVQCVKFTADGTKLVSIGTAPKLRGYLAVWNVADGSLLSGQELEFGQLYSVDLRSDGSLVLGCGPKQRGATDSEAVVIPFPAK